MTRTYAFLASALLCFSVFGCAQTAKNRLAQAESSLTTVRDTTLSLHAAGVVDDEALVEADGVEKAARHALDLAEARFEANEDFNLDFYLDLVEGMVLRIADIQARERAEHSGGN